MMRQFPPPTVDLDSICQNTLGFVMLRLDRALARMSRQSLKVPVRLPADASNARSIARSGRGIYSLIIKWHPRVGLIMFLQRHLESRSKQGE